jgi:hypothetical protein
LSEIDTSALNDFFSQPIVIPGVCGDTGCVIAIRVHAGNTYTDPSRPLRASNPPEDGCRNYAYPDSHKGAKRIADCEKYGSKTGPDRDQGQEAKAVGEGINIDILTLTLTQLIPASADLDACFQQQVPEAIRTTDQYQEFYNTVGCPMPAIRQVRDLNLTLGTAVANAVARPAEAFNGGGGGGGGGPVVPPFPGTGPITPPFVGPGGGTSNPPIVVGGGGLGAGKYALKFDWKSFRLKPWKAKDMAKGFVAAGVLAGMFLLVRRRLRLSKA